MRNYVAGLCLLAVPVISMGEPEIRIVSGTGTINSSSVTLVSGKYQIDITAEADDQMTIAVEIPQGASDIIGGRKGVRGEEKVSGTNYDTFLAFW